MPFLFLDYFRLSFQFFIRKLRILNLLFLFLFLCLGKPSIAQVEFLVTVNQSTGNHSIVDSLPGVNWISLYDLSCIDEINGRFVFRGADSNFNWALYSADLTTGNIISSPPFPILSDPSDNVTQLQFDNSTGILYGLHWDNSVQTEFLVSINPATGVHTKIDSIPGVNFIAGGYNVFDQNNGYYIFRGIDANFNSKLYSVDVSTGNVVSSPVFPNLSDPSDNVSELQFDNSTGILYGMHWDSSAQTEYFVSVNPLTGAHTIINSIPNVTGIALGYTTFDEINGSYIFRGVDSNSNFELYSIDVATGNIISNPTFPILSDPLDNVVELHFDNSTSTLFALHWDNNFIPTNPCIEILNISGNIIAGTYEADDQIISAGQINANSNGPVTFLAGEKSNGLEYIILENGFFADKIFNFSAINIACNPND